MTLEDINYIAQTVGVVAILGTFVAVLIQMRQTNRLLRNQAKRAHIDESKAISVALYQTPGLADSFLRAASGGLDALSPTERFQILAFLMAAERNWEGMFVQYQDGQIDEELWQAHSRHSQAAWNDNPAMAEFWRLRREFFMPEYRKYREAQIESNAGSLTLGFSNTTESPKSTAPKPAPVALPEEAKT